MFIYTYTNYLKNSSISAGEGTGSPLLRACLTASFKGPCKLGGNLVDFSTIFSTSMGTSTIFLLF